MTSAGESLMSWLGAMTLATGAVLLLALIADRALERRVSAAVRLLLYVAVLARLALPAGWTSPLGLLGGWRSAEAPAHIAVEVVAVDYLTLAAAPPAFGAGTLLLGLWLAVSLALLGFWTHGRLRLRRQLRDTVAAGNSDSGIPVLQHPVLGPLVAGAWRPRIVVPATLVAAPDGEPLRWVLRHESAHVQRRDPLLSAAVQVICLLAWPVLPIWIAARRIRTLMEIACDERAVANQDSAARRRYGEVLLALAAGAPGRSPLAGALSFASPLRGRLRALVPRRRWPLVVQAAVVAALGALAVACAGEPGMDDGSVEVGGGDVSEAVAEGAASISPLVPPSPVVFSLPGEQGTLRRFGVRESVAGTGPRLSLLPSEWRETLGKRVSPSPRPLTGKDPAADRPRPPASGERAPVVSIWRDGSAWVYTKRGGSRRLHYQAGGSGQVGEALTGELRAALAESGARSVLVRSDKSIPMAQVAPLLTAAKRAGARDHAVVPQENDQRVGNTIRPRPPILTVSDKGQLFLENRVVTLAQLEEHLRFELRWRKQDTLLIRGDKADMLKSVDVMAIAKRAGAAHIGILANEASPPPPTPSSSAGEMDPGQVAKLMRGHLPEVKRCYETSLARNPKLSGRMELEFTIASDGRVVSPALGSSTLNDRQAENCLLDLARTWTFPPPRGGPVEVSFPFVFSSDGAGGARRR